MIRHKKQIVISAVVVALAVLAGAVYLFWVKEDRGGQEAVEQTPEEAEAVEVVEDFQLPTPGGAAANQADKLVAENDRYSLYVNEKLGNVRIVEASTGKEWFSSPPVDPKMPPNNRDFIDAPVHVRYTQGVSPSQTYPKKEKAVTTMEEMDGGVRFKFDFEDEKLLFGFAVEYKLTEQGFEATVPDSSIYEKGATKISSLELLPFFGAEHKTEKGAVFVPDGSGALIKFREVHPEYFENYSEFVYGGDHAFKKKVNSEVFELFLRKPNVKQFAALPVYGIYRENQGFLAIITEGDFDAKVNATLPGPRNIDMYRASAEFVYRNDDIIFIGNSGEIPLFQGNRIKGDRTVRYVLLADDKANYVGMAHAYRDYLVQDKGVKPVVQDRLPLQIRLFGGVLRDEIIGTTYVDMTTFAEAKSIIDAFSAKGAASLEITIDGWSKGGAYGNQPSHFPVEKKLGGKEELVKLADYAKERGVSLYLKANYVRPFDRSDALKPSRDAIRGIDREVRQMPNYYISTRYSDWDQLFYMLKPNLVYDEYIQDEVEQFAELGVSGVHLQYMGDTLYSDHDPKNLTDRSTTAEIWMKTLNDFRGKVGKTAVDYGNAYTLGLVDRIDDIPVDSSRFTYEDAAIPFYQIAIHGLIPYTVSPFNLSDDPEIAILRALEYGALPTYELTYEPSTKLARTMVERIFSGEYKVWADKAVQDYQATAELFDKVKKMAIANHEQLSEEVFRTTYEDGTAVIVNYGDTLELVGNHSVPSRGYVIAQGGDQK